MDDEKAVGLFDHDDVEGEAAVVGPGPAVLRVASGGVEDFFHGRGGHHVVGVCFADPVLPGGLGESDRLHLLIVSDTSIKCKTQMGERDCPCPCHQVIQPGLIPCPNCELSSRYDAGPEEG